MSADLLESSNSSFFDDLDFDEADVSFLDDSHSLPAPTILDDIDEELFSMPDLQGETEQSLGLQAEALPNLYQPSLSNSLADSTHQIDDPTLDFGLSAKRPSRVTPEPSTSDEENSSSDDYCDPPSPPSTTELQRQCQLTLRKLAKSIRRSDATRSIVKRHKTWTYKAHSPATRRLSSSFSRAASSAIENFFQSDRCRELEESRRQLLRFISI